MKPTIKDLVKNNNTVTFTRFRADVFYYSVGWDNTQEWKTFEFPVPLEDARGATLECQDKAMLFMRWIRKAIADGTLVEVT